MIHMARQNHHALRVALLFAALALAMLCCAPHAECYGGIQSCVGFSSGGFCLPLSQLPVDPNTGAQLCYLDWVNNLPVCAGTFNCSNVLLLYNESLCEQVSTTQLTILAPGCHANCPACYWRCNSLGLQCKGIGQGDCCAGLNCLSGTCQGATCIPAGGIGCASDSNCCSGLTCTNGLCCAGAGQSCTVGGAQAECCGTLACNATSMTCGTPQCGVEVSGRQPSDCVACIQGTGSVSCACDVNNALAGTASPATKAQADACGYTMPVASTPPAASDVKTCIGSTALVPLAQTTATQSRQFISCNTNANPYGCTLLDTYVGTTYGQLVTAPIIGQDGSVIGNYTMAGTIVRFDECDPRFDGTMNLTFDPAKVQSVSSVSISGMSADDAWDFGGGQQSDNWGCGDGCNSASSSPSTTVQFNEADSLHYYHSWSIRDRCRDQGSSSPQTSLTATFSITYIPLNLTYRAAPLTYPTENLCAACLPSEGTDCSIPDNCCKVASGRVTQDLFCDNLTNPSEPECSLCKSSVGQKCSGAMPCCAPLYCEGSSGTCKQLCNTSGQTCASQSDCCSPLICNSGSVPSICTCKTEGMACSDATECCGEYSCSADTHTCVSRQLPVCSSDSFSSVTLLAGMAGIGMIALAAFVYMVGESLQNARMLSWAKSELWEVVFSLFVVSMILFTLSTFCNVTVGEVGKMSSSLPVIFAGNEGKNMYDASMMYLENAAGFGLRNIAQVRSNQGAYEIRTSFQRYDCKGTCYITMISSTDAAYSGESMDLAVTNNLLGTATISYLSVLFQYFTLQYIVSGLFVLLLPIAIVVRSVPFMRGFGGAIIGIIIALYIMYPMAQLSNAVVLPYLAKGMGSVTMSNRDGAVPACAGSAVFAEPAPGTFSVACDISQANEMDIGGKGITEGDLPSVTDLKEGIKTNVLMFLAGVFLPGLDFIVIAALARDISGLLGDEADIARLGQMV